MQETSILSRETHMRISGENMIRDLSMFFIHGILHSHIKPLQPHPGTPISRLAQTKASGFQILKQRDDHNTKRSPTGIFKIVLSGIAATNSNPPTLDPFTATCFPFILAL
jgi:hypothetical protein